MTLRRVCETWSLTRRECGYRVGRSSRMNILEWNARCPVCSRSMAWRESWRFATWYGRRQVAACPHCASLLRWNIHPWRWLLAVVVSFLAWVLLWLRQGWALAQLIVLSVSSVVMLVASTRRRLVVVSEADNESRR